MRHLHLIIIVATLIGLLGLIKPMVVMDAKSVFLHQLGGVGPLLYILPACILGVGVFSFIFPHGKQEAFYLPLGLAGLVTCLAVLVNGRLLLESTLSGPAAEGVLPGFGFILCWVYYLFVAFIPYAPLAFNGNLETEEEQLPGGAEPLA